MSTAGHLPETLTSHELIFWGEQERGEQVVADGVARERARLPLPRTASAPAHGFVVWAGCRSAYLPLELLHSASSRAPWVAGWGLGLGERMSSRHMAGMLVGERAPST